MTMITPSYLGETIEYSSLHACRSTLEDPTLQGRESWRIPVLPDGDYSIFLAADFRFGIFGHPWEGTWCVFGTKLLAAFETDRPRMFSSELRRSAMRTAP